MEQVGLRKLIKIFNVIKHEVEKSMEIGSGGK